MDVPLEFTQGESGSASFGITGLGVLDPYAAEKAASIDQFRQRQSQTHPQDAEAAQPHGFKELVEDNKESGDQTTCSQPRVRS